MWRGVGASHRAEKALAAARHDRSLWLALKTRNTVLLTGYLMGSAWLRWCAVVREHRAAMAVAGYRAGLSHGCLGWGVVGGRRGLTRLLLRKWSLVRAGRGPPRPNVCLDRLALRLGCGRGLSFGT